ncbi:MAG: hypothetical protein ACFFBY_11660 [Promethearchaeota archaeon]
MNKIALIIDNDEISNKKALNFLKLGGFEPIVKTSILDGFEFIKKQHKEICVVLIEPKLIYFPLLLKILKEEELYSHIKIILYKSSSINDHQLIKLDKEYFDDPLNFFKF